ncbi:U3 small nucleolar RNA-associated 6-like protein [Chlorella sorokiniana]|uniref:U3 small nucleolar RNA-associated 6-like protein n=1 Tax=Chlorella sorokiniana TaxID=3076 RepID=A0A2P6TTP5_CHLSO|nr:U3 small nucleolar RNA-associated 6-like protein [Chlorella sorokiniana]|eukprot:PRW57423.1 U3 small nucleolar RNA-associated 6-like protein [Chlorella sorokiniana]
MADTVRYLLEEMVPELEALEQRGYFSRQEIKAVVQKRQDFEYALKRKAAMREDYLRYIDYEERLEELRASRRSSRSISGKAGLAEFCIVRRIHFIFERATRKFRGDLDLWSRWLRFCQRTRSSKQMSKVLTKALQLHSGCAALWTYAAAWEFESNLNAGAARALMQRGLRMCKHAPQLWHEYFRLELLYALRLRERRRVLGIGAGDDDGIALGAEESEGGEGGDEAAAAVAAVLNGAVALVVYKNAIAAFPASVPFRAKFLEILAPLHFPGRASLEEAIYDSVAADFGGSAEAWDLRARRHTLGLPADAPAASRAAAVRAAVGVYEQGLSAVRTPEMAGLLLTFLQQQAAALDAAANGSANGEEGRQRREAAEWLRQRTQEAFEEAAADGLLTEALRLDGIAFFLHCGDAHAAAAAARAGTQALPQSAALWQQLLALEAVLAAEQLGGSSAPAGKQQGSGGSEESSDEEELPLAPAAAAANLAATAATATQHSSGAAQQRLEETALAALQAVPAAEAVPVWLTAVEVLCAGSCSLQALAQQLVQSALRQSRGPVEGGLGAVAAVLLAAVHRAGGIAAARALYRALLPLPPPGGEFFRTLLHLEADEQAAAAASSAAAQQAGSMAAAAAPLSDRQLTELFEAATDAYGAEDAQLWLQYAEWQASRGGPAADGAAAVYWKARKVLRRPEEFEAAYHLRFKLQPGAMA